MASNFRINEEYLDSGCSSLLTQEENQIIFSLLGNNSKTLSTTLVQLLMSEGSEHTKWRIQCIGIVCFVEEENQSFYIRIYDFVERKMLWEYHLSNQFEYKCPQLLFHGFETNDCVVGLNFSDEVEANHFRDTIERNLFDGNESLNRNLSKSQEKLSRKKLSKEDIGLPTRFRHTLRVGYNPLTGFEITKPVDSHQTNNSHLVIFNNSLDGSLNQSLNQIKGQNEVIAQNTKIIEMSDSCVGSEVRPNRKSIKPKPQVRTKIELNSLKSIGTQTETVETLDSVLVNRLFQPLSQLPPPPILKAMTYLSTNSKIDA